MKVEIRLLEDINNETGKLLEIVEVSTVDYSTACDRVLSRMILHAQEQFGVENIGTKSNSTIFGGHYYSRSDGRSIVAT